MKTAQVWLKTHKPLYSDIDIDMAEQDSCDPPLYECLLKYMTDRSGMSLRREGGYKRRIESHQQSVVLETVVQLIFRCFQHPSKTARPLREAKFVIIMPLHTRMQIYKTMSGLKSMRSARPGCSALTVDRISEVGRFVCLLHAVG